MPPLARATFALLALLLVPVPSRAQEHPRLWFSDADIPAIRAKAATSPFDEVVAQVRRNILSVDYPLRGGNIATTYLVTGDETWAEMGALRTLDYIANADRWENDSAFGLRRGIDIVAVAMLYDLCHDSATWRDLVVPATLAPKDFVVDGVTVKVPGNGAGTDPTGRWHTSYTGRTITLPAKYVGLPLRVAVSQALRNNADSNIRSGGSGWPGNDKTGNNWWAVRYGSAALAYLASDETGTATNLGTALARLKTHLAANLGTSPLAMGWNPEGIAYAQYPGWTTYPLAIALKRMTGRDLVAEHPAMRHALWSTYMGLVPVERRSRLGHPVTGTGLGIRPDFDDDHGIWEGEGTGALAFAFAYNDDPADAIPDFDYRPGLKYLFHRVAGEKGDRLWDSASGNGLFTLLYLPGPEIPERNPDLVWGRTYADPTYGAFLFRSGHQDADFSNRGSGFATPSTDIVVQTTANLRPALGGHDGPDAQSLRIIGLGVPWAVGSGRNWIIPAQSSLMPYDPTTMGTGNLGVSPFGNAVVDAFLRNATGDGYVITRQDTSDTGATNHVRRLVVDHSGNSGAPGLVITVDSADDTGAWWRLNTWHGNTVDVSVPGRFVITSVEGHRLVGTILHPAGVQARAGEINRGSEYAYRSQLVARNRWIDFPLVTDGHAVVAMSIVPSGSAAPVATASGSPAEGFTIAVGGASFSVDPRSNTITSPAWNPPSVTIATPAPDTVLFPAPAAVTVAGTASDDTGVARVDVYLDDVLARSETFAAPAVSWGPWTLPGVALGDHVLRVVATDSGGDTKAATRAFRVTRSRAPSVAITSPGSTSPLFGGQAVTLAGLTSDPDSAVTRVELWHDNAAINPTKLGDATLSPADGTWSWRWPRLPVGQHEVWAVAVSADGDATTSARLALRGSLFFSGIPRWGDAASYQWAGELDGAARWSVREEGGDLRLFLREMRNYDYAAASNALLGSDNADNPAFRLSFRAKTAESLADEPNYFVSFGRADAGPVVLDAQVINSIERAAPWTNAGRGTRVWLTGNSGYRTEILYTNGLHRVTDPGYPNQPRRDFAAIPDAGWHDVVVERVGKRLRVTVDGREILAGTHDTVGTRGPVGLGHERATGSRTWFDDIRLEVLDAAGNPVAERPAAVAITTPAPFVHLAAGTTVNLAGTATDPDGVAMVELFSGGLRLGEAQRSGDGWSLAWPAPAGQHALVARVTDLAGAVTESAAVRLRVGGAGGPGGNAAPVVTLAQDTTATGAFVLRGTATDAEGPVAGVQVLRGGLLVANATLSGTSWTFSTTSLPPGEHVFVARAFDEWGTTTDSAPLAVSVGLPSVALAGPAPGAALTVGLPATLSATATAPNGILSVRFLVDGVVAAEGSLVEGAWRASWTPRFHGGVSVVAVATDRWGLTAASAPVAVAVVPDEGPAGSVLAYAGGPGTQALHDVLALADGTVLVAGSATDLAWAGPAPRVELAAPGLPAGNTGRTAFLLHLAADLRTVLRVVHLPHGRVANLRWIKTTSAPGGPAGAILVSGACNASGDGTWFVGRLDGNFVDAVPSGFAWTRLARATNAFGDNLGLQAWDVGGDGRVVLADETGETIRVFVLGADGTPTRLPALRGSHFAAPPYVDASRLAGLGADFPAATASAISFPADLRSWTDADRLAVGPDGNGQIRRGRWPMDLFFPVQDRSGGTSGTVEYGYTGYKSMGKWRIGGIAVDRATNAFFVGFNTQSAFWDAPANKQQPDFEPAVVAYGPDGALRWWSRLYHEVVDADRDGVIDPGETRLSSPDQYVDGLAVDPSSTPGRLVVVARAHGNNASNLWNGNAVASNPGGRGFQDAFTGTEGNIHVSWVGKLDAADGTLRRASWLAGYVRSGALTQAPYTEPIHDGWPSHNAGWPNLTTTRVEPGSVRVDAAGRVAVVAVGPRLVTTFNAHQKLPRVTGSLDEGTAPWNAHVRVFDPDLATLVYSSAVTGTWTYPSRGAEPVGANNTELLGVFPVDGGVLVAGRHLAASGVAAGNPVPVARVPAWARATPEGETGLLGRLAYATSANVPPAVTLNQPSGTISVRPGGLVTLAASASDADGSVASVAFYANGTLAATASAAPFAASWSPPGGEGGTWSIQAIATDDRGATAASGTATVRVELAPVVAITAPAPGATVQVGQPVLLAASASDVAPGFVAKVEFLVDGAKVGEDTTAPFSFSWTPSATGGRLLQARATDNDGAVAVSPNVGVTVTDANVPPTVAILAPADGTTLSEAVPVAFSVQATDPGAVLAVELRVAGAVVATATPAPDGTWTATWVPDRLGLATFVARATDNQGASTDSAPVTLTLRSDAAPDAPESLVAEALSWRRVALTWQDRSANEAWFRVERSTAGGGFATVAELPAGTTSWVDPSCQPATAYAWRVRAANLRGVSAPSNTVSLTTPARALVTRHWGTAAPSLAWDGTSPNWSPTAGGAASQPWSGGDDVLADFNTQPSGNVVLSGETLLYGIRNLRRSVTAGTGARLQLGEGGLVLAASGIGLSVPVELLASQTWSTTGAHQFVGSGPFLGGRDIVLTWAPAGGNGNFGASEFAGAWAQFHGRVRLISGTATLSPKVENNGMTTPSVWELVGPYAHFSLRGTTTLGGLAGTGRVVASNANRLLVIDTPAHVGESFGGPIQAGTYGVSLTKRGTGTQAFSGTIAHAATSASLRAEAGTLLVNGTRTASSVSGPVTVLPGARLGGAGSVEGTVGVEAGAILAPGSAAGLAGSLAFPGELALADRTVIELDLVPGGDSDRIVLGPSARLRLPAGGRVVLRLASLGRAPLASDRFVVAELAGASVEGFAATTWELDDRGAGWHGGRVVLDSGSIVLVNLRQGAAGIELIESAGETVVAEAGLADTFAVRLASRPAAAVTFALQGDPQVTVEPAAIVFTPGDWGLPRAVTVRAVDDGLVEGAASGGLHRGAVAFAASSDDPAYAAPALPTLEVDVLDDEFDTAPSVAITTPARADAYLPGPGSRLELRATASDQGVVEPAWLTWSWTGGGGANFGAPASPATSVTFASEGIHVVTVAVSDGTHASTASIRVQVGAPPRDGPLDSLALRLPLDTFTAYGGGAVTGQPTGSTPDASGNGLLAEIVHGNGSPAIQQGIGRTAAPADGAFVIGEVNYGDGGYLRVADHDALDGTGALSISLWWRPQALMTSSTVFLRAGAYSLTSGTVPGKLTFSLAGTTNNDDHVLGTTFQAGRWYHLCFVFDGSRPLATRVRGYVDGVLDFEGEEQSSSLGNLAAPLLLGRNTTGNRINSRIDDFRIYRRALDPVEVRQLVEGVDLAPTVEAGADAVAGTLEPLALAGTIADVDSAPTARWSVVAGPGSVVFANPGAASTTAAFSKAGTYVLRLEAVDTDGVATSDTLSVTVTGPDVPTLVLEATHGRILADPPGPRFPSPGGVVTLAPVPDEGHVFAGWEGDLAGAEDPALLAMTTDRRVVARFEPIRHSLVLSATGGAILADPMPGAEGRLERGTLVRLRAYPLAGHYFAGWSGSVSGTANPAELVVDGPESVAANFLPYRTLQVDAGPGSVVVQPAREGYEIGEVVTVRAVPPAGGRFVGWSGDVTSTDNPVAVTFGEAEVVSLEARFVEGFDAWSLEAFAGSSDPAVVGPLVDPDRDGIPNLLEYALGTEPFAPGEAQERPALGTRDDGSGGRLLTLVLVRRSETPGITWSLETSTDLATWSAIEAEQAVIPLEAGRERVEFRTSVPVLDGPRFLRVRVTDEP